MLSRILSQGNCTVICNCTVMCNIHWHGGHGERRESAVKEVIATSSTSNPLLCPTLHFSSYTKLPLLQLPISHCQTLEHLFTLMMSVDPCFKSFSACPDSTKSGSTKSGECDTRGELWSCPTHDGTSAGQSTAPTKCANIENLNGEHPFSCFPQSTFC